MNDVNAYDELAFIKKVMEDSRKIIIDDGKGFIFWGVLVTIGLLVTYFSVLYKWEANLSWFWPVLIGFGWIYTIVIEARREKKAKTRTLAGKIMGAVWIGCGVAMTMAGFVGTISGAYKGIYVSPVIAMILGIGYLVTGVVFGKRWIMLLSIGWWAGSFVMFFWYSVHTLLLMSLLMLFLQVIPGIIMYKESKKVFEQ